ncbi:YgcG family protein [Flavicella sp.]|uniref:TPM domain-containing protein n=1 Tax=Flavicella sp. TaxID=2957742 RepID=UPI002638E205|nr:TPM domain-containing protein [Flavicella sp.]MDG1806048.1 TPM domain-containing protein [Flavicella sp.]MDG2279269.1 TPM domain-containing protein [Flavicella sp.]
MKVQKIVSIILLVIVSMTSIYSQSGIPDVPKKETSLYDYANLLSKNEQKTLERKLIRYSDSTSTQIVVVTMTSIGANEIAMFATELAHKWGIGQKGKDNGVLVLVAKNERKVNISTGYGVEHLLTDALSRRIIENIITPRFKSGNFYAGLDNGTDAIFKVLNGEFKENRKKKATSDESSKIKGFFIFVVLVLFFIFRNRGNKGGGRGGRRNASSDILTAILFSNMGRSSGGFGGGSSGGFGGGGFSGGFGGGGFGGGGASGSW